MLFVAIMALSATQLVGTESDAGALKKMEEKLAQQRDDMADTLGETAPEVVQSEPQVVEEWVDEDTAWEDELNDDVDGIDPSPDEEFTEPAILESADY